MTTGGAVVLGCVFFFVQNIQIIKVSKIMIKSIAQTVKSVQLLVR